MRQRILSVGLLAAILAAGLFGIPFAVVLGQLQVADARAEMERVADRTAVDITADYATRRTPESIPHSKHGIVLGLYDANGRLTDGAGPARADSAVRSAMTGGQVTTGEDTNELVVAVPVEKGERVTGAVRASTSRSQVYWRTVPTWLTMAGLALVGIVAATVFARWQAGRLAEPLQRLAGAAGRLGDGDFSVRARTIGIAEIDSVAQSLNSTADRLGGLVTRERAFSADASHQLRTPLTGLRLGLEMALEKPNGDLRPDVLAAIEHADRLERIVDDLLDLARDVPPPNEPLDVAGLLAELRADRLPTLTATGRSLLVVVEGDIPRCAASASAVRQILSVLLDNATVHGAGQITVTARNAGGALAIDVADEGPGTAVSEQLLFARRSGAAAGHGIGLPLARSLAEAEGGRLRLTRPAPPVFTLLLPARRAEWATDE
ncbi:sensor histidine kinase [Actinocatenispora comari]|uniref:histidine kinase n=1 Tax=Actinocatenispora comari TaxID=2807577 RepID=A0A8J4AAI5_9ACTN|nr:HAMP domain-containing sensor histidine kinase [Actinocatenispora comari]GIL27195.1 two-component sensor histidine kinase [Actinocatenispora comari]